MPVSVDTNGAAYVTLTNSAVSGAYTYTLPTANQSELGGIKTGYRDNGNNIHVKVDGSGNAYVTLTETAVKGGYSYTLPTAGTSTLGGICTGFSNTGSKVKVDMSSNNAFVEITKAAITNALGYTPSQPVTDAHGNPVAYVLPTATGSVLGGIKTGYTLSKSGTTLNVPVNVDKDGNAYVSITLTDLEGIGAITKNNISGNVTNIISSDE